MELCPKCNHMTAERDNYTDELKCYNIDCFYSEGDSVDLEQEELLPLEHKSLDIEEKIKAEPIDRRLPDGHICEKGQFKPYIQLVCSKCSPKNLETPKDVYFAHKLPTNDEQIEHLRNCILNHSTCVEKTEADKLKINLELQSVQKQLKTTKAKLKEVEEDIKLTHRYDKFCRERNDFVKKTAKPILDKWDVYVKSGQSVTSGTGETTISIPIQHIQAFARAVRFGKPTMEEPYAISQSFGFVAGCVYGDGGEIDPNTLRCKITGNRCGTDTWQEGHQCSCANCQLWIIIKALSESTAELAEAKEQTQTLDVTLALAISKNNELEAELATRKVEQHELAERYSDLLRKNEDLKAEIAEAKKDIKLFAAQAYDADAERDKLQANYDDLKKTKKG